MALWCYMGSYVAINISSAGGLSPDNTEPSPELNFAFSSMQPVAFTSGQFHTQCWRYHSLNGTDESLLQGSRLAISYGIGVLGFTHWPLWDMAENLEVWYFRTVDTECSLDSHSEIALHWMPQNHTNEKWTLIYVITWANVDPDVCHHMA